MPKKRRKLKNLKVEYVSYVDRAANLTTFYLTKNLEGKKKEPDFEMKVRLICSEKEEERKVYGLVYAPDTVDAHGDYTDADTLEKAAHNFMIDYQKMDMNHNGKEGAGKIVESFIAPETFNVNGEEIKKGSWVLVSLASEEVWDAIKKGEITGYSLAGTAVVEYERLSVLDILGRLFKKESIKLEQGMEVMMDEELKKALEEIGKISKKMEEYESSNKKLEESLNSVVETVKSLVESVTGIKKFVDDVKVDEIKKAFEDLQKKVNDTIEAISNSNVKKNNDENNGEEQEASRVRMI